MPPITFSRLGTSAVPSRGSSRQTAQQRQDAHDLARAQISQIRSNIQGNRFEMVRGLQGMYEGYRTGRRAEALSEQDQQIVTTEQKYWVWNAQGQPQSVDFNPEKNKPLWRLQKDLELAKEAGSFLTPAQMTAQAETMRLAKSTLDQKNNVIPTNNPYKTDLIAKGFEEAAQTEFEQRGLGAEEIAGDPALLMGNTQAKESEKEAKAGEVSAAEAKTQEATAKEQEASGIKEEKTGAATSATEEHGAKIEIAVTKKGEWETTQTELAASTAARETAQTNYDKAKDDADDYDAGDTSTAAAQARKAEDDAENALAATQAAEQAAIAAEQAAHEASTTADAEEVAAKEALDLAKSEEQTAGAESESASGELSVAEQDQTEVEAELQAVEQELAALLQNYPGGRYPRRAYG